MDEHSFEPPPPQPIPPTPGATGATPPPVPQRPVAAPSPPPSPYPRRSVFSVVVRIFGSIVVLVGAVTMGVLAGFYLGLFTAVADSAGVGMTKYSPGDGRDRIAILPISGVIDAKQAEFVRRAVLKLHKDERIKALVLRVESPGGGVTASDEIHHHLTALRGERNIPIVASYGSYAASGGYYVSALADHIYIQPTTLTGSIGVIAQAFTMEELLTKKLGVKPEIIASTNAVDKDMLSPFRNWTDDDRDRLRVILDAAQEQFVKVVDEGRKNLNRDQVVALATGRAMTAGQALDSGLVDELGYIDSAIAKARDLAHMSEDSPPVVIFRKAVGLSEMFREQASAKSLLNLDAESARSWMTELSTARVLYLMKP